MTFSDPRQVTDPERIACFAATTSIQWRQYRRGVHHGHLAPGGDHLLTVVRGVDGTWTVDTDADAVFDVGHAAERLTVVGRFSSDRDAMRAAESELAALLRRLTGTARR